MLTTEIPSSVQEAFTTFHSDPSLFALPLTVSGTTLQSLSPIAYPESAQATFQTALNRLDTVLDPKTAIYLILRRNGSLVAITFVPYLAKAEQKKFLVSNRNELVQKLGLVHFSSFIICKEIGEIADARSWDERDGKSNSWGDEGEKNTLDCSACEKDEVKEHDVKDLGYKKNKCRLCDRRMKNEIEDNALKALAKLDYGGACVQIVSCLWPCLLVEIMLILLQSVDVRTEILQLNFHLNDINSSEVAEKLPTDRPSFTFYRHPSNNILYFVFCSPDSATVVERMKHTIAIAGLVNIIAKDNGVHIDQKIEIHDPEDLDFIEGDERIGKFRSVYLRNNFLGTESRWEGMEEYQKVLDSIR